MKHIRRVAFAAIALMLIACGGSWPDKTPSAPPLEITVTYVALLTSTGHCVQEGARRVPADLLTLDFASEPEYTATVKVAGVERRVPLDQLGVCAGEDFERQCLPPQVLKFVPTSAVLAVTEEVVRRVASVQLADTALDVVHAKAGVLLARGPEKCAGWAEPARASTGRAVALVLPATVSPTEPDCVSGVPVDRVVALDLREPASVTLERGSVLTQAAAKDFGPCGRHDRDARHDRLWTASAEDGAHWVRLAPGEKARPVLHLEPVTRALSASSLVVSDKSTVGLFVGT